MFFNFFVLTFIIALKAHNCTVVTNVGIFHGRAQDGICSFRNIPYAEPFGRLAQSRVRNTPHKDPVDASEFGPACLQFGPHSDLPQSEDCLSMNIWTPRNATEHSGLPVLFWIHGGGFIHSSGQEYDGTWFARNGVVLITINFRLSGMGFYATEKGGGMNGIYDQINALDYVQAHIRNFGGDPNEVTIFGESSGGISVCILCHAPVANGLFSRAIIESGGCYSSQFSTRSQETAIENSKFFLVELNMTEHEFLTASEDELIQKASSFTDFMLSFFGPVAAVDGLILPKQPIELPLLSSIESIMVGHTSRDMPLNAPPISKMENLTREDVDAWLSLFFDEGFRNDVYDLYQSSEPWEIPIDMCTKCQMARFSSRAAEMGAGAYSYIYDFPKSKSGHTSDLGATWNVTSGRKNFSYTTPQFLIDIMMSMHIDMANGREPNSDIRKSSGSSVLLQADHVSAIAFSDSTRCDFWNKLSDAQDLFIICSCLFDEYEGDCSVHTTQHPKEDTDEGSGYRWMWGVLIFGSILLAGFLLCCFSDYRKNNERHTILQEALPDYRSASVILSQIHGTPEFQI